MRDYAHCRPSLERLRESSFWNSAPATVSATECALSVEKAIENR